MSVTNGLIPFLIQQQGVDTTYMADFIRGFKEMVKAGTDPKLKAYAAGMEIAGQLRSRMLPGMSNDFTDSPDSIVADLFYRGFADALSKDSTHFTQTAAETYFRQKHEADMAAKQEKLYGANRDAGRKFLEENAKRDSVVTLPSGLQYQILVKGEGEVPQASDKVKVNYEGRLIDGTVFDASAKHGSEPAEFTPAQVIKGWTEALTMMPVGSKWRLFIPSDLAYGDRDTGAIKPYSTLIFDVELVEIVKK
jgi:FKBP-type peptidyl-prolyl cis-trans isomerase FklB